MIVADISTPEISVVMPAYNASAYIAQAIQSVLRQTHHDFELLVIDDGSTDDTHAVVRRFDDPRIVFAENSQNVGLIATLTKGLALCRGKYIARMDADDISEPERLAKQARFLQSHPEIDIVGGAIHFFGNIRRPYTHVFPSAHEDIRVALLFYCPLAHPALMFRRSLVERRLFSYSEEFRHAEDYHLWSQLLQRVRAANLPDLVLHYRLHPRQVSSRHGDPQYEASKRVRGLLLEQAKVSATSVEVNLHESIVLEKFGSGTTYLNGVAAWFDKLELANQNSRFWDQRALHMLVAGKCKQIAQRVGLGRPPAALSPRARRYLQDAEFQPERFVTRLRRRAMHLARHAFTR